MKKKNLVSMLLLSTVILGHAAPVLAQTQYVINTPKTASVTDSPETNLSDSKEETEGTELELPVPDLSGLENLPLTESLTQEPAFTEFTIKEEKSQATSVETGS